MLNTFENAQRKCTPGLPPFQISKYATTAAPRKTALYITLKVRLLSNQYITRHARSQDVIKNYAHQQLL